MKKGSLAYRLWSLFCTKFLFSSALHLLLDRLFKFAISIVFPPSCVLCKRHAPFDFELCDICLSDIKFIDSSICVICGIRHAFNTCTSPYPTEAAIIYNKTAARLLYSFKYKDKTRIGKIFGVWLRECGKNIIQNSNIIAPVPLHRQRLQKRKYNQSLILAQEISKHYKHIKLIPNLLLRRKNTTPQYQLTSTERIGNISNAFECNPRYASMISGKRILIVDDILTTGATTKECARALDGLEPCQVSILALARTVR
ncbi:ComF family protein [Rickettsiales endosymbiont of Peranema trichophorum]|uniref:ComF family protein n=1 Tax=Rickettsiales endosymbiont of Peranema trichophorum TaxID=2486577 RepID=UPI0030F3D274